MTLFRRKIGFLDLLRGQISLTAEATGALAEAVAEGNGKLPKSAERIQKIHVQVSATEIEVVRLLKRVLVTPLDSEDIHRLSSRISRMAESLEEAALLLAQRREEAFPPKMGEILKEIHGCLELLRGAIAAGKLPPEEFRKVRSARKRAWAILREGRSSVYASPPDPITLMKYRQAYDLCERALERAAGISEALERAVLKHG